MTRDDTKRLFDLLAVFRPGDKHLADQKLLSAWALVLEPYEVDDVRAAVAEYFRREKYWPDVTDICLRCKHQPKREAPPPPPPQPRPAGKPQPVYDADAARVAANAKWLDEFLSGEGAL